LEGLAADSFIEPEGAKGQECGEQAEADQLTRPAIGTCRSKDEDGVNDEECAVQGADDTHGLGKAEGILERHCDAKQSKERNAFRVAGAAEPGEVTRRIHEVPNFIVADCVTFG